MNKRITGNDYTNKTVNDMIEQKQSITSKSACTYFVGGMFCTLGTERTVLASKSN